MLLHSKYESLYISTYWKEIKNKRAMRPWIAHLRIGYLRLNSFSANGNMRFLTGGNVCWYHQDNHSDKVSTCWSPKCTFQSVYKINLQSDLVFDPYSNFQSVYKIFHQFDLVFDPYSNLLSCSSQKFNLYSVDKIVLQFGLVT